MQFETQQAIYLQIAEYVHENILGKKWKAHDKLPSVREMSIHLEVNPNTVMRTYAHLESVGIIYKQRGIGYFIADSAFSNTLQAKQNNFFAQELPDLLKKIRLLNISWDTLTNAYHEST